LFASSHLILDLLQTGLRRIFYRRSSVKNYLKESFGGDRGEDSFEIPLKKITGIS